MRNLFKKTPSMTEIPNVFSPIYVNTNVLKSDKMSALYKFSAFFFPSLGKDILNLLLDLEKQSKNIIGSIDPEERKSLIE